MRVDVALRWADLDAQGHVNNARYIDYLQDARSDVLHALGLQDLLREGFAVVSNQIEYQAPVFFSLEPLQAEVSVSECDEESVTFAYELFQNETRVARAFSTLSGWDVAARSRRPLPARAREVFTSSAVPAAPLRDIEWADMTDRAHVATMRVRWSDLDAYGHVNNAMIFDYIQEGRITFTAAPLRGTGADEDPGHMWFLVRQDVRYLSPIVFRPAPYVVRTGISHLGNSSLTSSSQVDDPETGTVCAQAVAVAVFADNKGHPTPLTDEIRTGMEQYLLR